MSVVETASKDSIIECRNMTVDIRNRKNGRNISLSPPNAMLLIS
jgi:hypothetical protein